MKTNFTPEQGVTYLARVGIDRKPHLHIILTYPTEYENSDTRIECDEYVLVVNISTVHRRYKRMCILNPGDHPFITRESYVVVDRASLQSTKKLINEAKSRRIEPQDEFLKNDLLEEVCDYVFKDPRLGVSELDFYRIATR